MTKLSSKEISLLIVKSQLKIIDCCEDILNYQNGHRPYLSNAEHIYYRSLLDDAYDEFFSEIKGGI